MQQFLVTSLVDGTADLQSGVEVAWSLSLEVLGRVQSAILFGITIVKGKMPQPST